MSVEIIQYLKNIYWLFTDISATPHPLCCNPLYLFFFILFSFLNSVSLNSLSLLVTCRSHKPQFGGIWSLGLSPLCICHHLVSIRAAPTLGLHNTRSTAGSDLHAQATFSCVSSSRHMCVQYRNTRRHIGQGDSMYKCIVCASHRRACEHVFV